MCGCIHDEIKLYFPELANLIKWHLCSSDGPLHYLENTLYWVKEGKLDYARESAIAPDATLEQLGNTEWLINRLPALMNDFKQDIESLGFTY